MYLDKVITMYESLGLSPTIGCTETEVQLLEQRIGHTIPAAYREFLLWAGQEADSLFSEQEDYKYQQLPDMQALAHHLIHAYQFPSPLPHDALVFYVYDSVHFAFIRTLDGPDPLVYHFLETPNSTSALFISNARTTPPITYQSSLKGETVQHFVIENSFSLWIKRYIDDLSIIDEE